jgi:hypothetical protein
MWRLDPSRSKARKELVNMGPDLPRRSPKELLEMLKQESNGWDGSDVGYWRVLDGNEMIIAELKKRGEEIFPLLRKHKTDLSPIFAGTEGRERYVASVCNELLGLPENDGIPKDVDHHKARKILEEMEKAFPSKTAEDLIGMLRGGLFFTDPVQAYVVRDGNKLIEKELERRGEEARPALLKHTNDSKGLFTGYSGPVRDIGSVCRSVLKKLDEADGGQVPRERSAIPAHEGAAPAKGDSAKDR